MPGSPFNRIKLWKNIRGFAHKCFFQHYRCSVKKGESRGELGFSALEKYRRESRFCLWHNMTEVFEWSVGSCLLSRSFFHPPLSLPPLARPRPLFLIPSFFSNAIIPPFLHFRDVECVQALTFAPHKWKREGVLFLLSSGSYSMERYRVPSLWYHAFVSITSNFLFFER